MSTMSGNPMVAMIRLYDDRVRRGEITTPLAWKWKPVGWILRLADDGSVRGMDSLEGESITVGKKTKKLKNRKMLPECLVSASNGSAPDCVHGTLKYISDPKFWSPWRNVHLQFSAEMRLPQPFVEFLSKGVPPLANKSGKDIEAMKKIGPNFVVMMPDGSYLHELPGVKGFWNCDKTLEWHNACKQIIGAETEPKVMGYSSISGKWVLLAPKHASPGAGVVPGAQSGAKFGAVNDNASSYYSYGWTSGMCVPMSIEESFKVAAIMRELASANASSEDDHPPTAASIISNKNRHMNVWRKRMETSKTLLVAWGPEIALGCFEIGSSSATRNKAVEAMRYMHENHGGCPPGIGYGDKVHFLAISARTGGRLDIEDYWCEDAPSFIKRLGAWYQDPALFIKGEWTYMNFYEAMLSLRIPLTGEKKISESAWHAYRQIQWAVLNGKPIPVSVKIQCMKAANSILSHWGKDEKLDDSTSPLRLFRTIRMREGVQFKEGEWEMLVKSPAYRLGELVVRADDAKQSADYERYHRRGGLGLTPTGVSLCRTCLSNPRLGLTDIRRSLMGYGYFGVRVLAESHDGFDALKPFNNRDRDDFMSGLSAGLAVRQNRIQTKGAEKRAREAAEAAKKSGKAA